MDEYMTREEMSDEGSDEMALSAGAVRNPDYREPEVGMGATYAVGSDRYTCTIVAVQRYKSGAHKGQVRAVVAQDDLNRVISGSAQDGSAVWDATPNPNAEKFTALWNDRRQRFVIQGGGSGLALGVRNFYQDPSF